jgi:hypothetical protein
MFQTDNLFTRLSLDESLRRTYNVYAKGFMVFTKIAALAIGIQAILWAVLLHPLLKAFHLNEVDFEDPMFVVNNMKAVFLFFGIKMLLAMFVGPIAEGALIQAVVDIYTDRQPRWLPCVKVGLKNAIPLFLASFLAGVVSFIGLIFFYFPGVYLAVTFFVVTPAILVEKTSSCGSLKRSYNLVSGSWCYVFCTFFIVYVIMVIGQMIWSAIFAGGNDLGHTVFSVWGSLGASIFGIFMAPLFAITKTIMYFSLRVEKEGLNADVFLREVGGRADDTDYRHVPLIDDADMESPNDENMV